MKPVYRVLLGGIHPVKETMNYAEAKDHYLMWTEEVILREVKYNSVSLTKDHIELFEYKREAK